MTEERVIHVEALARVEGEGALTIRVRDKRVEEVQLRIFEPPRLFEAFLRGRRIEEVPDITARICGICPVAYQMSTVHALEAALDVTVPRSIRQLRRLLYCGEWIESHALHMHLLQAPDFLGYDSGLSMAQDFPREVTRGLTIKKYGNEILEVLGGRAIHPVNVAVGGFHRLPRREELTALLPHLQEGLALSIEVASWVSRLNFPAFTPSYEWVALVHPDEYPMNEGVITSRTGEAWLVNDYETAFEEIHLPHTTALQSRRSGRGTPYFVGPIARLNLNWDRLHPIARQTADGLGIAWPTSNPFHGIVARALEVIHAFAESIELIQHYQPTIPARQQYSLRDAEGCAATEAPRGLLYHRYRINREGTVDFSKIVPPTSQNQAQIEEDLRSWVTTLLDHDDRHIAQQCEFLIRNYDPCISCATHFLRVTIDRREESCSPP